MDGLSVLAGATAAAELCNARDAADRGSRAASTSDVRGASVAAADATSHTASNAGRARAPRRRARRPLRVPVARGHGRGPRRTQNRAALGNAVGGALGPGLTGRRRPRRSRATSSSPRARRSATCLEVSDGRARLVSPTAVAAECGPAAGLVLSVRGDAASHWKPLDVANGARDSSRTRPPPKRVPPPPTAESSRGSAVGPGAAAAAAAAAERARGRWVPGRGTTRRPTLPACSTCAVSPHRPCCAPRAAL